MPLLSAGTSLAMGLALSGLSRRRFWVEYASIGGSFSPDQLRAYLDGTMCWPAIEHDAAAHVLNESCTEMGFGFPVAYASDL